MNTTFGKIYKSKPELLPEIEEYIIKMITSKVKLSDEKINNIELAVAEAAANSMLHGNKSNPQKNVTINITLNKKKVVLSFKDEGKGFNPKEVPDPTKPENILKGSGRGLHIMRALADDLKINSDEKGTELILNFQPIISLIFFFNHIKMIWFGS